MEMGIMVPVFIVLAVLGFVIFIVSIAKKAAKKRAADLLALSQEKGYSYQSDDKGGDKFYMKYGFFRLFTTGRKREASNIISFQDGDRTVMVFDYTYTTGSGKSQNIHVSTNIIIHQENRHYPHFFIRREIAVFDFLGKVFGGQDINYDEDEEFSKAFVLQGQDEEQTRAFFSNPENRFPFLIFAEEKATFEGKEQYFHYQHYGQILVDNFVETVQQVQDLVSSLES